MLYGCLLEQINDDDVLDAGVMDKNGQLFEVRRLVRGAMVIAHMAGLDENVHVNGYTFILDFSGFGTKHMMQLSTEDMRNWFSCWQVHVYVMKLQIKTRGMVREIVGNGGGIQRDGKNEEGIREADGNGQRYE